MLAKPEAPFFQAAIALLIVGLVTAPFGGATFERFYPGTVSYVLTGFWLRDLMVHQYALWAGLSLAATAISRARREPTRGRLLLVIVTLLLSLLCGVAAELLWGPWV